MSRWDESLGVNSDDPDDLEIGCLAFSKTHVRGTTPRGGTVVNVIRDTDEHVMSVVTMEQRAGFLETFQIERDDVDMGTVEWYGRNATKAAEIIATWVGGKNAPRDRHLKLRWFDIAAQLSAVGASGQWLPGAERRYQRELARRAS